MKVNKIVKQEKTQRSNIMKDTNKIITRQNKVIAKGIYTRMLDRVYRIEASMLHESANSYIEPNAQAEILHASRLLISALQKHDSENESYIS